MASYEHVKRTWTALGWVQKDDDDDQPPPPKKHRNWESSSDEESVVSERLSRSEFYVKVMNIHDQWVTNLTVEPNDSILIVKSKMKDRFNLEYDMVFKKKEDGTVLGDDVVLQNLGFIEQFSGSYITLVLEIPNFLMKVHVTSMSGDAFTLKVLPSATVGSLKYLVALEKCLSFDDIQLIYNETSLNDDEKTLESYNILHGRTVSYVVSKKIKNWLVEVNVGRGPTFQQVCQNITTVAELKEHISGRTEIPVNEMRLTFFRASETPFNADGIYTGGDWVRLEPGHVTLESLGLEDDGHIWCHHVDDP
jgi:hypothetical protein